MNMTECAGVGGASYYYEHYENRPPEHYLWLILNIIKQGRPGNILDLGCGTGLLVEMASKWGLDAMGCEGSEDAIKIAHGRNRELNIIHCLLSGRLPYADSSIDNVILNQVIEHLPPNVLTHALSECVRILRRGGGIFIYSPNKANKREVQADPTHINPLYPTELREMLELHGFEIMTEPNTPRFDCGNFLIRGVVRRLMMTRWRNYLSASTNVHAKKL